MCQTSLAACQLPSGPAYNFWVSLGLILFVHSAHGLLSVPAVSKLGDWGPSRKFQGFLAKGAHFPLRPAGVEKSPFMVAKMICGKKAPQLLRVSWKVGMYFCQHQVWCGIFPKGMHTSRELPFSPYSLKCYICIVCTYLSPNPAYSHLVLKWAYQSFASVQCPLVVVSGPHKVIEVFLLLNFLPHPLEHAHWLLGHSSSHKVTLVMKVLITASSIQFLSYLLALHSFHIAVASNSLVSSCMPSKCWVRHIVQTITPNWSPFDFQPSCFTLYVYVFMYFYKRATAFFCQDMFSPSTQISLGQHRLLTPTEHTGKGLLSSSYLHSSLPSDLRQNYCHLSGFNKMNSYCYFQFRILNQLWALCSVWLLPLLEEIPSFWQNITGVTIKPIVETCFLK